MKISFLGYLDSDGTMYIYSPVPTDCS